MTTSHDVQTYPVPEGRFVRIPIDETRYEDIYDLSDDKMRRVRLTAHLVRLFTPDESHLIDAPGKVELAPGLWAIHNYDIEY